ncbi:hypothetical protein [Anaerosporobacter faecicola]|nr:hypothetical protein [Anaerosporobacter faecicola]
MGKKLQRGYAFKGSNLIVKMMENRVLSVMASRLDCDNLVVMIEYEVEK